MKKVFICLLSLLMIAGLTACGKGSSTIDYGGSIGKKDVTNLGEGLGTNYVEKEVPEEVADEDSECHFFEDDNAIIKYIITYRFPAKGNSLETVAESENELYGSCHVEYLTIDGIDFARFPYDDFFRGEFFYGVAYISYDKETDEYVETWYNTATEEIAIGDSGLYAYVPKGYKEGTNNGGIVNIYYENRAFNYPNLEIAYYEPFDSLEDEYEKNKDMWVGYFEGELPFDYDKYEEWSNSGWTDEDENEYLGYFGEILDTEESIACGKECRSYFIKAKKGNDFLLTYMYDENSEGYFAIRQQYANERTLSAVSLFLDSLHEK